MYSRLTGVAFFSTFKSIIFSPAMGHRFFSSARSKHGSRLTNSLVSRKNQGIKSPLRFGNPKHILEGKRQKLTIRYFLLSFIDRAEILQLGNALVSLTKSNQQLSTTLITEIFSKVRSKCGNSGVLRLFSIVKSTQGLNLPKRVLMKALHSAMYFHRDPWIFSSILSELNARNIFLSHMEISRAIRLFCKHGHPRVALKALFTVDGTSRNLLKLMNYSIPLLLESLHAKGMHEELVNAFHHESFQAQLLTDQSFLLVIESLIISGKYDIALSTLKSRLLQTRMTSCNVLHCAKQFLICTIPAYVMGFHNFIIELGIEPDLEYFKMIYSYFDSQEMKNQCYLKEVTKSLLDSRISYDHRILESIVIAYGKCGDSSDFVDIVRVLQKRRLINRSVILRLHEVLAELHCQDTLIFLQRSMVRNANLRRLYLRCKFDFIVQAALLNGFSDESSRWICSKPLSPHVLSSKGWSQLTIIMERFPREDLMRHILANMPFAPPEMQMSPQLCVALARIGLHAESVTLFKRENLPYSPMLLSLFQNVFFSAQLLGETSFSEKLKQFIPHSARSRNHKIAKIYELNDSRDHTVAFETIQGMEIDELDVSALSETIISYGKLDAISKPAMIKLNALSRKAALSVHHSLLRKNMSSNSFENGCSIFEDMKRIGVVPVAETYRILASCAKFGKMEERRKMFEILSVKMSKMEAKNEFIGLNAFGS